MKGSELNAIEVANLNKSFGNNTVLKDINFSIAQGETFGLVGVNGIGKTTLLKIILDLLTADSGEVKIYDKYSTDNNARRKLSYLPEKFYPSQFLKGYEFLTISAEQFNKKYDADKAKLIAQKLDLDIAALDKKISKYSKGMGQKLGLISVFLSESELLVSSSLLIATFSI